MAVDKIPIGQLGFLTLTEEGAVLSSGGDLENDEHVASVLYSIVKTISKYGPMTTVEDIPSVNFHKLSINYGTYVYCVVLSNKKFHIVKSKCLPLEAVSV